MRPDRILVGEVRGEEVIDMLAAMSTGHDGSLSTGHANSPESMLSRLESMAIAGSDYPADVVRRQITHAIDVMVHLARDGAGHRRVMEIAELGQLEGNQIPLNVIYRYEGKDGLVYTGNPMKRTEKARLRSVEFCYGSEK